MAGLLDFFSGSMSEPQQQGLLAAAAQMLQASGPSLRPVSFGQVVGSGVGAYQQVKQDAEQNALASQLRGLQIKGLEGELEDKSLARKDALSAKEWFTNYNKNRASPAAFAQSVLGSDLRPTVDNAAKLDAYSAGNPQSQSDPFIQRMSQAQAMRDSGNPLLIAQADKLEETALKFKPKYSTDFRTARGEDGKLHNYVLADDGTWKDTGLGVKPEMTEVDLGGERQFVDKNTVGAGQVFKKTMTFADRNAASRLAFDKEQATSNQDAVMDPLAIRMTAQQYLAGDTGALQNFGRGAQGAQNLNAVRLEIARQAAEAGMTGADIAAKVAEFGGMKAGQRTAGTRSASIEIAAQEAAQLAPLALEASSKVARSGFLPFGKAQVMFNSNTNDPSMRQFAMANTALVNAYGQAMARGGTATVSDKEHARELLSTAMDQPSYAAAVDQLMREIKAAQAAPKAVRKDLSNAVSGREEGQHSAPQQQKFEMLPPAAQFDGKRMEADNGTVYRSVGGKWVKE